MADRLWLVKDGRVNPYEDDLQAYRKMLLSSDKPAKPGKPAPPPKRASRDAVVALRSDVRKCEERVGKLNAMADKLSKKLADPELYEESRNGEMEVWQKKYAEVRNGLDRAEAMWMAALEKLEKAEH